jgi:hypothetical protein
MKIRLTPVLSGICLAAALVLPAGAVPSVYDITVDHATGGLGTGPFGSVSLNQNGTGVDFIVHINTGYGFVLTGSADFMNFKFNATGVSLSDITITQNAPNTLTAQTPAPGHSFDGDGTGQFGFGITGAPGQGSGGSDPFSTDIKFNVADSTISDFTVPNNLNFLFVVDVISPNGNTGPAAVPGGRQVPDGGSTMSLLGAGLVGLSLVRRKFGKKS